MAEVFQADIADIGPIAENMREADVREVWLSSHMSPYEALRRSLEVSELAFTIVHEDQPIGMFGVRCQSLLGKVGIPWLLGTDKIREVRRQFIYEGPRWIEVLQGDYRVLMNYVHADNAMSLKWLKGLGFTIMPREQIGPEKAWFHKFTRIIHVQHQPSYDHRRKPNGGGSSRWRAAGP